MANPNTARANDLIVHRCEKMSRDKNALRCVALALPKRRTALRAVLTTASASAIFMRISGS
jgi:hypothetical protein